MIRRRAYNIWCSEGWPKGRDKEHWEQASNEVDAQMDAVHPFAAPEAEEAQVGGDVPWLRWGNLLAENPAREAARAAAGPVVAPQQQGKLNTAAVGRRGKFP